MTASILGMGIVAPAAQQHAVLYSALGGPVPDELRIEAIPESNPKERRLPRIERMALAAAREALSADCEKRSLALVFATGYGGLASTVDFLESVASRGPEFGSPTAFYQSVHHSPAGQLSIALGLRGASLTVSARELSGETALRVALTLLKTGRADKVLLVAADERSAWLDNGYRAFGVLAGEGADPERCLDPGEGAGALLLGTEPAALRIEECTVTAHPCPVLQFPTREQFAPLIQKAIVGRAKPLTFSLAAPNAQISKGEASILRELPGVTEWSDSRHFGFHGSAGLLRLIAAAVRLRHQRAGATAVIHGLSLGGGQAVTVMRNVT